MIIMRVAILNEAETALEQETMSEKKRNLVKSRLINETRKVEHMKIRIKKIIDHIGNGQSGRREDSMGDNATNTSSVKFYCYSNNNNY